jgi:tetratricopeptide (TPR) repeat protein
MGFFAKLREWLGSGVTPPGDPTPLDEMREAMEVARLARRGEDYERALSALDRAMRVADAQKDTHSVTIIALHQADVLIDQGSYDEAKSLLQTVQQTAEAVNQSGFMAYALISLGTLHQKRGEWEKARQAYEQARELAEEVNSPGALGRAMGYLADVYLHENNASYAVHLLQESLPKLNAAGDLELSSYFVGRLGQAMIDNGQEQEGYPLLDRALRLGEQMQDKRMIRRWSVAIGDSAYDQQRYSEAYMFYKRALPLFDARPEMDYITTLTRTSRTSLNLGKNEEALLYAEQALQVSQKGDNPRLTATAAGAMGVALRANGRNDEAIEHLQTATSAAPPDSAQFIDLLRQLAATFAAAHRSDEAEHTYYQTLERTTDNLALASVRRDLGLLYATQDKHTEALEVWKESLAAFKAANQHNQVARLHCDIANAQQALGRGQRAVTEYEQALITLNSVDDIATRGLVLANAANAYADQGDIESAESFFQESIDIARKIADKTAESTRQGNYGWFLAAIGKPRKGIEQLTAAMEISKQHGLKLPLAVQTDNMGLAYDALSQYKTALEHHERAQERLIEFDPVPLRWQVIFQTNTAKTQLALGRVDEAAQLADTAITTARQLRDYEALTAALIGKARVLLAQAQAEAAQPIIAEAVHIARQTALRRRLAEGYAVQSETEAALGHRTEAEKLWDEAKRLYHLMSAPQARHAPHWLNDSPPPENPQTG